MTLLPTRLRETPDPRLEALQEADRSLAVARPALVGVAADQQLIVYTQVRNTIRQVGNTIGRNINIDAGEIRAEANGVMAR